MLPAYLKLTGFDTEHTRFASKYSLYLYREESVQEYSADDLGLRGAPVLFVPGNAGSYKQVRSLSSEAARYFHDDLRQDQEAIRNGARSLDFFMVDFNEDLAAFHGQTLVDQADYVNEAIAYILALYHDPRKAHRDGGLPDPSSVILIGHSMGGIVARTVLVSPEYQPNTVNTIITMSTPHAKSPVSFDALLVETYQRINHYWREAYLQRWASNNPLWHTTLISIAGGGLDTTIPSDYTSISSLVPETHGFTVFTSTIPDVWTGMDHLAITWCDQIRKSVVKALYEITDVRRSGQTRARAERMKIFKKWFLTGLEEGAPRELPLHEPSVLLTLDNDKHAAITRSNNITIRNIGAQDEISVKLLTLPSSSDSSDKRVTVLTNQQIDKYGTFDHIEVLFCSAYPLQSSHSTTLLPVQYDFSHGDPSATRLACKRPARDGIHLPASTIASKNAFEQVPPFTYLQYAAEDLEEHQFVAVVDKSTEVSNGWIYAEVSNTSDAIMDMYIGLGRLLMGGLHLELPAARPLLTEVRIPTLHSSLLAYTLRLGNQVCEDPQLFTPLLRQYVEAPYESKFFVNMRQAGINLHGLAPFMPPSLKGEQASKGVAFQLWSDPSCGSAVHFSLHVDILGSMGKLVVRYRTVFAAFPLLVVAMVMRKQFRIYDSSGVFITFMDALDQSLKAPLPILLLSMTLFASAFTKAHHNGFHMPGTFNGTEGIIDYTSNDLLLGSQNNFFWFLVPLAGLISIGACIAINHVILALVSLFAIVHNLCSRFGSNADEIKRGYTPYLGHSTPRRRILNTVVLLLLVATIIPYQFAYLVACIVQLATCTRALRYAQDAASTTHQHNFFNYTHSILVLMIWVLPINLPVLVVWVHNLAVHWLTPFSSHHNVLSIMPFICLVEMLASGSIVPRMDTKIRYATNLLFFVLAVYAALYGVTYAYRLHYLANIVALWLVGLHFSVMPGFSMEQVRGLLEDGDGSPDTDELKKMP